ncbi:Peptidase C19 ubiquitin carboxyl-terminal hydrolase [Trinorchestia longiramus]|nr:Peptidase C19 ubiquitin carboxyl-terminal hydrolase [Trinorchestia longiramus]
MDTQTEDEKISLLMAMGFPDLDLISQALKASRGDINEAVSMLTENTLQSYSTKEDLTKVSEEQWSGVASFPNSVAQALHNRVFADSWNIPYKKHEALGQCIAAAINLTKLDTCMSEAGCRRFLDELLPECFQKLMDAGAVRRWTADVQEGVLDMAEMLLDLSVVTLQCSSMQPHPGVLSSLAEIFTPKNEFHIKNKYKKSEYRASSPFAISSEQNDYTYGWLLDLLNKFGDRGGFDALLQRLTQPELPLSHLVFMMKPISVCCRLLRKDVIWPTLHPVLENVIDRLSNMTETHMKSADAERCFQLLEICQLVCSGMWLEQLQHVTSLHFHLIYTMIKLPHFSARINALKGLGKLISDSEKGRTDGQTDLYDIDYVQNWMTEKRILFYALDGNLDQIQYTERIRELMDTLAPKLRMEDLTRIWQLVDRAANPQVVDNIHSILEVAAKKFNPMQFEHILSLVCKSFESGSERLQEKLLTFLGTTGRDNRLGRTAETMLDVVWGLARRPELPAHLVDRAMKQHLNILSHSATRDSLRRDYMVRCITDIKRSPAVYLPLKQLHVLAQSLTKGGHGYFKTEKSMLSDICRQHQLIGLLASSLTKCHQMAVQSRGGRSPLPDTLIDGKYTHKQYLSVHMEFLKFLLKEGELFLSCRYAKEIWDTLVTNPCASAYDKETCFSLLRLCLEDLESSSQRELLLERLLLLAPADLTRPAYTCLLAYWTAVNHADRRLTKLNQTYTVESLELLGQDYLWRVLLECSDLSIVNHVANLILAASFFDLSSKLKKNPASLHHRFIKDCYRKLNKALCELTSLESGEGDGDLPSVLSAVTAATNTLTAMAVTTAAEMPPPQKPSWRSLVSQVERLVCLSREYISRVEEGFAWPRMLCPHAATFHGVPLVLSVTSAAALRFSLQTHSHETIRSLRSRIMIALTQQKQSSVPTGDQFSHFVFTTRRPKNSLKEDYFKITPSKDSPWTYSLGAEEPLSSEESDSTDKQRHWTSAEISSADSQQGRLKQGAVEGSADDEGLETVTVILGERDNKRLAELGIVDSCELKLMFSTAGAGVVAKSAAKENCTVDSWNELPGPSSYCDSTTSSSMFSSSSPQKTSSEVNNPSDNANNNVVGDGSSSSLGAKLGILDRLQSTGSRLSATAAGGETDDGRAVAASSRQFETEKCLPGVLMAEKGSEVFCLLFELGRLEDKRIVQCARALLHTIPTHTEVLDRLDAMASDCGDTDAAELSLALSEASSSEGSSPAKRERLREGGASAQVLRRLLAPAQPSKNLFTLLYNLEAVSSKLLRSSPSGNSLDRKFCGEFLKCGGLQLLWRLLEEGALVSTTSIHAASQAQFMLQREIHFCVLHLFKLLMCGLSEHPQPALCGSSYDLLAGRLPHGPFKDSTVDSAGAEDSTKRDKTRSGHVKPPRIALKDEATVACNGPARAALLLLSEADWLALLTSVMRTATPSVASKLILRQSASAEPDGRSKSSDAPPGDTDCIAISPDKITCSGSSSLTEISAQEAHITALSVSVFVSALTIRPNLIGSWYGIPGVRQYLLELVLGCSSQLVREAATLHLTRLTQLCTSVHPHPKLFVSLVLVKAPLPLWVSTSHARGAAPKIISQSLEYFKLRSFLLSRVTPEDEVALGVSVRQMLEDEVNWLTNFTLTRPRSRHRPESAGVAARRVADDTLCAGHLMLVRALFTAPGVDLLEFGHKLIPLMVEVYLFPAAVMILDDRAQPVLENAVKAYNGKCCGALSREEAFLLLLQLCDGHPLNLASLAHKLLRLHHSQPLTEWEVCPSVESRAVSGFVGLKNGGATCYMNSVLQQLFLVPGVREDLLSISLHDNTETSLLYQLQTVFGHLLESELQFYEPCKFWESFRMDGQPVNIREQQDAFEFYTRLVEQVDDCLKKRSLQRVFAKRFEGLFSIQRLCQDCPHRFEREESFLSLNLTVKKLDALHSSLEQLVKGELLEGDNACYCDICRVKGRAVVRTCIKSAPQVLTIQLKRFGYDYDRGRSVKYDDHYEFPWLLDLAPYTAEYLAEVEDSVVKKLESDFKNTRSTTPSPEKEIVVACGGEQQGCRGGSVEIENQKPDIIPVSIREALSCEGFGGSSLQASLLHDEDAEMISPDKGKEEVPPTSGSTLPSKPSPLPIRRSNRIKNVTPEKIRSDSIPEGRMVKSTPSDGRKESGTDNRRRTRQETLSSSSSTESGDVFAPPPPRASPQEGDAGAPHISQSLKQLPNTPSTTPPSSPYAASASTQSDLDVSTISTVGFATPTSSPRPVRNRRKRALLYDLVGVVVHSGQAAAGHYYSYIKDRRGDSLTNPNKGRWFKFNDTTVEAVEMTQAMLEHEFFGGQYTAPASTNSSLPEERSRYWSGYLLFYERRESRGVAVASSRTPATAPRLRAHSARSLKLTHGARRTLNLNVTSPGVGRSRRSEEPSIIPATTPSPTTPNPPLVSSQSQCFEMSSDISQQPRDERNRERLARSSLSELRELMEEGEKRGIFSQQRLPPHILSSIVHHNLELYRNRCIYLQPYYDFLAQLCSLVALPSSVKTTLDSVNCNSNRAKSSSDCTSPPMKFSENPNTCCAVDDQNNGTADRPVTRNEVTRKLSMDEVLAHSQITKLALSFLFNTYLRLKNREESVVDEWCRILTEIMQRSPAGCGTALEFFSEDSSHRYLRPFLLHPSQRILREHCSVVLKSVLRESIKHCNRKDEALNGALKTLVKTLLDMLRDAVPSAVQHSQVYFSVLLYFCSLGKQQCHLVLSCGGFSLLMLFLLGKELADAQPTKYQTNEAPCNEESTRRWTTVQSQEFGLVHTTCAELILSCDLSCLATSTSYANISMASLRTNSPLGDAGHPESGSGQQGEELPPERAESPVLMDIHNSEASGGNSTACCRASPFKACKDVEVGKDTVMADHASHELTHGEESKISNVGDSSHSEPGFQPPGSVLEILSGGLVSLQWLSIVLTAYRELLEPMPKMTSVLMSACQNNKPFSTTLLSAVLSQYGSAPTNMLRELSQLLLEALTISDSLHEERVVFVLEGGVDVQGCKRSGLLELINEYHTSDIRRAYQCMKLCVSISSRFPVARDVLSNTSSKWQWAVDWLRDTIHSALDSSTTFSSPPAALSNEGSHTNVFQRTTSAQMTLEEATMLLSQMEPTDIMMDTENSNDGLGDIREDSPTPSNFSGSSARWT